MATTVIEVGGRTCPPATLMVIEQAERFGLAQLHQLRGRVGRGRGKNRFASCCAGAKLSETGRARLALMRETQDGFRIAEEDLALRGGGRIARHAAIGGGGVSHCQPRSGCSGCCRWPMPMHGC